MKTKNIYQFRSWVGTDASNEISLFEYGLLFNPNAKKNHCNILYGVEINKEGDYISFQYASINWNELISETWIEWEKVAETNEMTVEQLKTFSIMNLESLVRYYGSENIFGPSYEHPFKVNGKN